MKQIITCLLLCISFFSFSQEEDKAQLLAAKKANDYVYEGNNLVDSDDFVSAEMEYRKAISEQPTSVTGAYNLANSYIQNGNAEEALFRLEQAVKTSDSKEEKYKAFHNIGNVLMQNEKCKEAVEAYKSALRNNPSDDETRYNLAVAKACAEEQKEQEDQNKDQDKDDENKDDQDKKEDEDKDKEGENEDDKKDKEDEEKKDGDDKEDEEPKPEDDKKDEGKGDEDKKKEQQPPKPQPGQLSPQQIKSLLEAMNNQEQEVQEKINAERQKGVKVKTEKDW